MSGKQGRVQTETVAFEVTHCNPNGLEIWLSRLAEAFVDCRAISRAKPTTVSGSEIASLRVILDEIADFPMALLRHADAVAILRRFLAREEGKEPDTSEQDRSGKTSLVNGIMARDLRIVGLRDQITCHERGLRRMKAKNVRLRKRVAELEAMLPFHGNFDED